jgi:DNA-binding CsgD family transcriptional regulator
VSNHRSNKRLRLSSGLPRLPPARRPAFAGCPLTASELQVVRLLAGGISYETAARETRRKVSTIRSLLHTAYARLGVTTIAQALAVCTSVGWLDEVRDDGALVELADHRVTWAQRLYLEAFDQTLRAGDDEAERERTGQLRSAALGGMYREAGTSVPPWRVARDPLGLLLRDFQRLNAPQRATPRRVAAIAA